MPSLLMLNPRSSTSKKIRSLVLLSISLLTFFVQPVSATQNLPQGVGPGAATPTQDLTNIRVQVLFFYSNSCSHCLKIIDTIVNPMSTEYPGLVDFKLLELGERTNYEALMTIEEQLQTAPDNRDLPVVVIGNQILTGEEQNNTDLRRLVEAGIEGDPIPLPEIEGVDYSLLVTSTPQPLEVPIEACSI